MERIAPEGLIPTTAIRVAVREAEDVRIQRTMKMVKGLEGKPHKE